MKPGLKIRVQGTRQKKQRLKAKIVRSVLGEKSFFRVLGLYFFFKLDEGEYIVSASTSTSTILVL